MNRGGRIAGLRISPASALAGKARDLLLRIRWDEESEPAVICPAGDFFGYAWGKPAMTSLFIGAADDTGLLLLPDAFFAFREDRTRITTPHRSVRGSKGQRLSSRGGTNRP